MMTRHLTGTEANALTDEQLKTSPFFSGFHDETILVTSNGVDIASNLELRARVLAHGIPAESFAVGTGEVGNPGLWENVDMTTVPNGGNTPVRPQGHQLWTHSAFVGLPLKDVSRLFKDLNSRMKGQTHE